MEEVFMRFPHIGIQFFEKLDDSNLAKCREVSKSWKNFIDSKELPRKRIHQNWEKTLQLSLHEFTNKIICGFSLKI